MTSVAVAAGLDVRREASPRRYLMCAPTHFEVTYAINPWMDPTVPVDRERALAQWRQLVDTYRSYGHQVDLLDPVAGLPDMVFTANGATVVDGRVLIARLANPQRAAEATSHAAWHRANAAGDADRAVAAPVAVNEAEGDFAVLGDTVLAGYGFRTTLAAHGELADLLRTTGVGRRVVSLELVDPHFYHLDVALAVLDDRRNHVAYYPEAFSAASRRKLADLFPDAVLASREDAYAFGLNAVSDGLHVFVPAEARGLIGDLAQLGYQPVPIELTELTKSGGSVKCCTQEIRSGTQDPGRRRPRGESA